MSNLFISDLHLTPDTPAVTRRFLDFLETRASRAEALYILGDFFEAWVGDDDLDTPFHAHIAAALRRLTDGGVALYFMHGNRDFLLGEGFCAATGGRLLPEPSVIDLYGTPTLLLHGDSLCTDDQDYQRFRARMRDPAWQQAVLARPIAERRVLARQLREQSEATKGAKAMTSQDVNPQAAIEALRQHGCRRLIHGHTHLPARHIHDVDGHSRERWVLPDWEVSGGYLLCDASGCVARPLAS